jgi:hypothetical protein
MPQSEVVIPPAMYWPDGERPSERWPVYYAFYALMLGGFVAGCAIHAVWMVLGLAAMFGLIAFHQYNGRSTAEQIAEQLKLRPSFPAEAWGSDDRAAFAAALGRIVADEIGWPNSHFLPDDPLDVVLYSAGSDGGEGLAISYNFEKAFGRRCEFGDDRTFGEFVDRNFRRAAA